MVLDFQEWRKCHFHLLKRPFPHSRFSARNENLWPLLNTNIPRISGTYGLRNHFWPLESCFLMRKSKKKGPTFLGPMVWILKFTYSESSHWIRQLCQNRIFVHFCRAKIVFRPLCASSRANLTYCFYQLVFHTLFTTTGRCIKRLMNNENCFRCGQGLVPDFISIYVLRRGHHVGWESHNSQTFYWESGLSGNYSVPLAIWIIQ